MTSSYHDDKSMLEKLTAIRDIGANIDASDIGAMIEASMERTEAFGEIILRDYPILGYCGCGTPENTVETFLKALQYCTLNEEFGGERAVFLQEHFGTDYVSDSGIVQFLFYSLVVMGLTEHIYSLNFSTLTPTGEVFLKLLTEYVEDGTELT